MNATVFDFGDDTFTPGTLIPITHNPITLNSMNATVFDFGDDTFTPGILFLFSFKKKAFVLEYP